MAARSEVPETRATSTAIEPFLVESERLWFADADELDEASEGGTARRVSITHGPLILLLVCEMKTILEPGGRSEGVCTTTS